MAATVELIRRTQGGDRAALDQLFARYYDDVHRAVRLLMGSRLRRRRDSGDVVHEAFLKAIELIDDFEIRSDGHFRHWLVRIATNRVLAHVSHDEAGKRDIRREIEPVPTDGEHQQEYAGSAPTPSAEYRALELLDRLTDVLESLPEDQRRVWVLRTVVFGHDAAWQDIGDELGRGAEAARKLYERARLRVTTGLPDNTPD